MSFEYLKNSPQIGCDSLNPSEDSGWPLFIYHRVVDCISPLRRPAVHQNEFLDPLAGVNFPGIEMPVRIRHYLMKPMKLPGIGAVVPCLAQDSAILLPESPDDVVLAVGRYAISGWSHRERKVLQEVASLLEKVHGHPGL